MGFKTKTHQTDHGPIEYLTTQPSKSKETIIFFHGFADSKHSFYGASLNLFRNYQIIIPDLPGFGKSFKQQSLTYDIESYCQWMVDWLKSLNIDKAHIVGNSLGGGIAISIAHMVPELVKSLTTINPAGVPLPGYPSLYQELFEGKNIWVMENRKEFDSFIERAFYKKVFIPWAIREKTFFEFLDNKTWYQKLISDLTTHVNDLKDPELHEKSLAAKLADIATKTLIIWGTEDTFFPYQTAFFMKERLQSADIKFFKSVGHSPQIETPIKFSKLLKKFVQSTADA